MSGDGVVASGATVPYALDNLSGNNTILGTIYITTGGGNTVIQSDAGLLTLTNITNPGVGRAALFNSAGNGLVTGVISNSGTNATAVQMSSSGVWTLTGSNTYTGSTNITSGTLQLGTGLVNQDGSIGNTSGVGLSNNAALIYNLYGSQTAPYNITGAGSLTLAGSGMLTLAGTNSNYSGATTISGGTLQVGSSVALGGAANPLTISGGALDLQGFNVTVGGLGGGGTIFSSSAGGTPTLTVNKASGVSTYGGTLANGLGSLALTKVGNSELILTGSNSFGGGTTITAGTLQMGNASALGAAGSPLTVNGGMLDLQGYSVTVGTLGGSGGTIVSNSAGSTTTLTVNMPTGASTYGGSLTNGLGTLALDHVGQRHADAHQRQAATTAAARRSAAARCNWAGPPP